ncbi:Glyoxalase-like domain protein [Enterococcus faecium]|nr:Glyoxalase-like domain protein [Enterococcus faecium]SAZ23999.1 Glyoxalase-like domain protein [Enterococcus faecium]
MKLNGLQHIGIPTKDFGASKIFYESLGFSLINEEMNVGSKVGFFELNGTIIEIWEDKTTECRGAIDHLALDTDDIDEVLIPHLCHPYLMLDDQWLLYTQ